MRALFKTIALLALLFFACPSPLRALDISVDYGLEKGMPFSVLTISHDHAFTCVRDTDSYGNLTGFTCEIMGFLGDSFTASSTKFFKFNYKVVGRHFFFYVYPKHKARIFPVYGDLTSGHEIVSLAPLMPNGVEYPVDKEGTIKGRRSKVWQIVGYTTQIPFLSRKQGRPSINFPVRIEGIDTPSIPILDIARDGLDYTKGDDFTYFNSIKVSYQKGLYQVVIKQAKQALKKYKDSIFAKDFMLYEIRALSKLSRDHQDDTISAAKKYIYTYPTSQDVPEVLYLLGNASLKVNNKTQAKTYYERAMSEYSNNKYALLSMVAMATNFSTKNNYRAAVLFRDALKDAKDANTASEILVAWALHERSTNKQTTIDLLDRVLKKNPGYFLIDKAKSFNTAISLAGAGLYNMAAEITYYIIQHSFPQEPNVDKMTELTGEWFEMANNLDLAHAMNRRYIANYPKNPQLKDVVTRDNKLLFGLNRTDSEKLKIYDYLIENYKGSENAQKALNLKAKIFYKEKKYEEVLKLAPKLSDKKLVMDTHLSMFLDALKANKCQVAIRIYIDVKDFPLPKDKEDETFNCLYKLGFHKQAIEISKGKAQAAKNPATKLKWLYLDAKNYYALGYMKLARLSAHDAFILASTLKKSEYYDIGLTLFDLDSQLGDIKSAKATANTLEKLYAGRWELASVYDRLLKFALKAKNYTSVSIYAKKILDLEARYKHADYSPTVDFYLVDALNRLGKVPKALEAVQETLKRPLSQEQRQKALYLQGNLYNLSGMPTKAKASFSSCMAVGTKSPWLNLCSEAAGL